MNFLRSRRPCIHPSQEAGEEGIGDHRRSQANPVVDECRAAVQVEDRL